MKKIRQTLWEWAILKFWSFFLDYEINRQEGNDQESIKLPNTPVQDTKGKEGRT